MVRQGSHSNGQVTLLTVGQDSTLRSQSTYGPFNGWIPQDLVTHSSNTTYLLWTHTSGRAQIWVMKPDPITPVPDPSLVSFTLSSNYTKGGNQVTGTVMLSSGAPAGGIVISLKSSDPSIATVPTSVTVPAGSNKAHFTVSTGQVLLPTTVNLSATYKTVTETQELTVSPIDTPPIF